MSDRSSRSIYVGNLPGDIRESEIEDLFYKVSSRYLFFNSVGFVLHPSCSKIMFFDGFAVWPHC